MTMLDFFRIEDFEANGPYRLECWAFANRWEASRNPAPQNDGIGDPYPDEVFGFRNLSELNAWFTREELESLILHPLSVNWLFRITHYEVRSAHVRHGQKQCVADRRFLMYKSTILINEYLEAAIDA